MMWSIMYMYACVPFNSAFNNYLVLENLSILIPDLTLNNGFCLDHPHKFIESAGYRIIITATLSLALFTPHVARQQPLESLNTIITYTHFEVFKKRSPVDHMCSLP